MPDYSNGRMQRQAETFLRSRSRSRKKLYAIGHHESVATPSSKKALCQERSGNACVSIFGEPGLRVLTMLAAVRLVFIQRDVGLRYSRSQ